MADAGRRAWDDMIDYETFWSRKKALNWSQDKIDDEWRAMDQDPDVEKEDIYVRGVKRRLMSVFGGIQRYNDAKQRRLSGFAVEQKLDRRSELNDALQQRADFARRITEDGMDNRCHGLRLDHAGVPSTENRDIVVPVARQTPVAPGPLQASGPSRLVGKIEGEVAELEHEQAMQAAELVVAAPNRVRSKSAPNVARAKIQAKATTEDIKQRISDLGQETQESVEDAIAELQSIDESWCEQWITDLQKFLQEFKLEVGKSKTAVAKHYDAVVAATSEEVIKQEVAKARDAENALKQESMKT